MGPFISCLVPTVILKEDLEGAAPKASAPFSSHGLAEFMSVPPDSLTLGMAMLEALRATGSAWLQGAKDLFSPGGTPTAQALLERA